jgi:quinol monooxygenase YgiN
LAVFARTVTEAVFMSLFIIRMTVISGKYKELSQTIALLIGSIRAEQGCRRCDVWRSMENENQLFLLEEWDTREDLNRHLNSERFKVLRGAMNLLQEPCEMTTCELV